MGVDIWIVGKKSPRRNVSMGSYHNLFNRLTKWAKIGLNQFDMCRLYDRGSEGHNILHFDEYRYFAQRIMRAYRKNWRQLPPSMRTHTKKIYNLLYSAYKHKREIHIC